MDHAVEVGMNLCHVDRRGGINAPSADLVGYGVGISYLD